MFPKIGLHTILYSLTESRPTRRGYLWTGNTPVGSPCHWWCLFCPSCVRSSRSWWCFLLSLFLICASVSHSGHLQCVPTCPWRECPCGVPSAAAFCVHLKPENLPALPQAKLPEPKTNKHTHIYAPRAFYYRLQVLIMLKQAMMRLND